MMQQATKQRPCPPEAYILEGRPESKQISVIMVDHHLQVMNIRKKKLRQGSLGSIAWEGAFERISWGNRCVCRYFHSVVSDSL